VLTDIRKEGAVHDERSPGDQCDVLREPSERLGELLRSKGDHAARGVVRARHVSRWTRGAVRPA
jgi:hypothetical protein